MLHNIEKAPDEIKDRIDDALTTGFDKVEEIPTVRQVNGVWQTGKMPTSAGVLDFVGRLTTAYLMPIKEHPYDEIDIDIFNRWWDTYRSGNTPINDWATSLTDHEAALLEYACKVLSSNAVGNTVHYLKVSGDYPSTWGSGAGLFRSTSERLFDRLRINHKIIGNNTESKEKGDKIVIRWPYWFDRSGILRTEETTLFGRRHSDNGFYLLREKLSSDYRTLGKIIGLTDAPDTFAMPLEWSEAVVSGLSPSKLAKLSADTRKRLLDFADDLDKVVKNAANTSLWGGIIAGVAGTLLGSPALGALFALFGSQSAKLVNSIDHWPNQIRRAASESANLNDTAFHLLKMLRITDLKGLLGNKLEDALDLENKVFMLDLYDDQVQDVEYAMRPDELNSLVAFQPMILLGDTFANYASNFGINPKRGVNPFQHGNMKGPDVVAAQRYAADLWTTWWNDSQPTLDIAYVIDTASIILEQLLYLDDALLALNDIAVGDGMVAMMVRKSLAEQGLTRYVDALGGASPGAALRYFFRQILTDLFIDWVGIKEGVEATDLYPILCWMNTKEKRDRIEDALGPLIETTPENAGGMWGVISALRLLFGYVPDPQPSGEPGDKLRLRGAYLPNVKDNQKGALGRIFGLFGDYPDDPEQAAEAISHCELGNMRGWLELARQSCLRGLQAALEPHWTYATDPPNGHIPPDLSGDLPRDPSGPHDPIDPLR